MGLTDVYRNLHFRVLAAGLLINTAMVMVYAYINGGSPWVGVSDLRGYYGQGWPIMVQTFVILYFTQYSIRWFSRRHSDAPNSFQRFSREFLFVLLGGFALMLLFHWIFVRFMVVPEADPAFLDRRLKMILAIDAALLIVLYAAFTAARLFRESEARRLELAAWQQRLAQSRYQAEEERLNPTFLFAELDRLQALVQKDPDAAEAQINELARTYRVMLERAPLPDEDPGPEPTAPRAAVLSPLRLTLGVVLLASLLYPLFFAYIDQSFSWTLLLREWLFTGLRFGGITLLAYGLLRATDRLRLPILPRQLLALALLGVAAYGFLRAFAHWIDGPLTGLQADPGDWTFRRYIGLYLIGTLFIFLFFSGLFLYRRQQAGILQEAQVRRELAGMRLQALRNQVNPHFLFNSLSVLSSLVQVDSWLSQQFIRQLGKAYRYITERQEQVLVSLDEELSFLDAYFFLLHIRFGDKIRLEQQVAPGGPWYLPPMTLQLLVENAVKHNAMSAAKPLVIRIATEEGWLEVRNNRSRRHEEAVASTGIGLQNIQKRYALMGRGAVRIEATDEEFAVRVPLLKNRL